MREIFFQTHKYFFQRMIFRNVCFWLHRQLFLGFISVSCMLITAEIEATDGTFIRLYLKLYCFEEFLDYLNDKRSLDRATLLRATSRLRDDAKYRNDYLQLKLREARWDECATEDEIVWPFNDEAKKQLMQGEKWETVFESSRFASTKVFNWVDGDFLKSAMMFPLRSIAPYSDMYFYHSCARIDQRFIFINLGSGYEKITDYTSYLNRKSKRKLEDEEKESDVHAKRYLRLSDALQKNRLKKVETLNTVASISSNPDEILRQRREPRPIYASRPFLVKDN